MLVAVELGERYPVEAWHERGRRVFNMLKSSLPYNLISWDYIQPLRPAQCDHAYSAKTDASELHPADIADISQISRRRRPPL
jgi:hypothetical protein